MIDGTLIPVDRVAADRPSYSGKHRKHGMNLQVIARPPTALMPRSVPLASAPAPAQVLAYPAQAPWLPLEGLHLERHIYLILPLAGETSPAARRFADQLLRIHPAGS